ncbi:penicillin acylase family protein [Streptomyces caniscabiei]|uniref:Penicillin acylase family protein n=1 Tax=Streptomyces caniscabiei TaxID=2746961 RepID=A0ABU4MRK1_9ACTN|nr:penicillin acylase family protein [Streptomyces caniscabiei]MBE4739858.1 penicillin acylase family protein [Streptomyces caniscabiei]MBE4758748.1 penicillin acylase family protein [Streptomyces caniscabiei]MBE4770152.1 penicillin acylase family protein [Streptomyces caniscabiei]MBE4785296.1 penicillin acylase family protein [Streptomyces caniscabiei]MBE4797599.1 penicillin acylase family protein [Streptomyces caniscabiei]
MPTDTTPSGQQSGKSGRKKGRKVRLLLIVLVLAIIGGVGYGAFWSVSTVRASFPQTKGSITLDGLSGPVDVKRDGYGIPQIYASSDEDLFMAQGYVQAQDRFYEMDVRRHMTAGRLSEMFGESQVDNDEFLRTLGWHRIAEEEYEKTLSAETKKYLDAYAKGVNAYLAGKDGDEISVEYAALGFTNDYTPEEWTPVDSVAWLKAMAWDLRGNMQDEIDRALMTSRLGPKQIADLYPQYPYSRNGTIVREGQYDELTKTWSDGSGTSQGTGGSTQGTGGTGTGTGGTGTAAAGTSSDSGALQTQLDGLYNVLEGLPEAVGVNGNGIGSNSWVVSGDHTITGKPLLANDPHLTASLPSVWYQMGLHCKSVSAKCQYDVSGYTFSGMPGVVIGHNADIAWGMTNSGVDVTDLYLEKLTGDGYQYGSKVLPFDTREETIEVAGGASKTIVVRTTNNGPLLSDRYDELVQVGKKATVDQDAPDRGDGYGIALRWTALDPGTSMDAVFAMNRAKGWDDFREAAALFDVPSQNLIYADTEGHIGYQLPGKIPTRGKGDGSLPAPGWDPRYRWTGYIDEDELPYEYDPERGYIVTANQAVVDKKYPFTLTTDWGYGTRAQRITSLIESKIKGGGKISTDDMRQMQMDNSSEIAKLLVPLLLKIDVGDKHVREAQKLLEGWDYTQDADSAAAAYFNSVWRNILKLAFGDKLPKELRVEGQCLSVEPVDSTGPADEDQQVRECGRRDADQAQPDGGDRWFEVVRRLVDDQDNAWWSTPKTRNLKAADTRDELFKRAMRDARWELTAKLGKDIDSWSWGRLHRLFLKNQTLGTAGPGFLQYMLNRGPWKLGGGEATVNATGWNAAGGYEVVWVPSMRMVVNLGDLDKSKWINLTGASGHAYNAHYTDQTDKWVKGELLTWSFSDKAVQDGTSDTLLLKP